MSPKKSPPHPPKAPPQRSHDVGQTASADRLTGVEMSRAFPGIESAMHRQGRFFRLAMSQHKRRILAEMAQNKKAPSTTTTHRTRNAGHTVKELAVLFSASPKIIARTLGELGLLPVGYVPTATINARTYSLPELLAGLKREAPVAVGYRRLLAGQKNAPTPTPTEST